MRSPSRASSLVDTALVELWDESPEFHRLLVEKMRQTLKSAGIVLTGEAPEDEQITELIRLALEDRAWPP
jgi:hypothetical protein